jgi:hypothetical protein
MVLIAIEKIDWCRFGNPAAAYRQWSGDWSPLSSDPRSVVVELLVSAQEVDVLMMLKCMLLATALVVLLFLSSIVETS